MRSLALRSGLVVLALASLAACSDSFYAAPAPGPVYVAPAYADPILYPSGHDKGQQRMLLDQASRHPYGY